MLDEFLALFIVMATAGVVWMQVTAWICFFPKIFQSLLSISQVLDYQMVRLVFKFVWHRS